MTDEEIKRLEASQEDLKRSYKEISASPAVQDLLRFITAAEDRDMRTADAEMENATRKALYLQSSRTYSNIKAHLVMMIGDDANARN